MTTFRPRSSLRRRVAAIDVIDVADGDALVLPSTSAVLGFQFRGRVRFGDLLLAPAGVTGIQSRARTYSYVGGAGSVLVRFTPQGAGCLGVPVAELSGSSVALDSILPRAGVAAVHERLAEAHTDQERVAVVEDLLEGLPDAHDALVARALEHLSESTGGRAVARVARELGIGERQLERRFLARVGMTPKGFASLRRFERAVALASTAPTLTEAALGAGYYDQSHFTRDFRHFSGVAPGKILRPR